MDTSPDPVAAPVVLVVDDDAAVRGAVCRMLRASGYAVLEAAHGAEAWAILDEERPPVDLVLTDVCMPQMGGPALAARVAAARPVLPVLFMTGSADSLAELAAAAGRPVAALCRAVLRKPFTPDELLRAVRAALARA
jgi:two-component system, cell cycle sensor histidine kinase and response regulator CckA